MSDGEVRYIRDGQVATVIFDRPAARNAMTWRMYEQLGEACARIGQDDGVRVAVFRGAGGKAFIAGTDIAQFQAFRTGEDGIAYEEKMEGYLGGVEALPVPTLAVVEGFAHRRRAGDRRRLRSAHRDARLAFRRADRPHARQLPVDCELCPAGRRARRFAHEACPAARRESFGRGGAGGRVPQRDRRGGRSRPARRRALRIASRIMRRSPCG